MGRFSWNVGSGQTMDERRVD